MCGISALLSKQEDVRHRLIRGLSGLLSRGYDSAGCLLVSSTLPNTPWSRKFASRNKTHDCIDFLKSEVSALNNDQKYSSGIAHLRWSTHGGKTDANAHPHCDETKRFWVVHNGIISNYDELKSRLINKGYKFESETDTEVVAVLMLDCMRQSDKNESDSFQAWQMVIRELEGTWALLMIDVERPECLYAAKNGSPLIFAFSKDNSMMGFASEYAGFDFVIQKYASMEDGDVIKCKKSGGIQDEFVIQSHHRNEIKWNFDLDLESFPRTPTPYTYWTEKEIFQQPDKIWNAINCGGRLFMENDEWKVKLGGLDKMVNSLSNIRHVIIVGCGSSFHAGLFSAKLFREISGMETVQVFDATECEPEEISRPNSALVLLSQSGETADCARLLKHVRLSVKIGIVNAVGSLIARETDCGIYLNAGRENGVASTKSFTNQCIVLSLLAMWFAQHNGNRLNRWAPVIHAMSSHFQNAIPLMKKYVHDVLESKLLHQTKSAFILGKGYGFPIALEAALKLKELTYIHFEGFAGSTMKHGSFALIDPFQQQPVFLNIWRGSNEEHMISTANQLLGRGAKLVILTNLAPNEKLASLSKHCYFIPVHDEYSASLVSILFYQLLAFEMALSLGHNPDCPRNLAKTVTVT